MKRTKIIHTRVLDLLYSQIEALAMEREISISAMTRQILVQGIGVYKKTQSRRRRAISKPRS